MKLFFDNITFLFRLLFVVVVTLFDSTIGLLGMFVLGRKYYNLNHYRAWAKRLLFFSGVRVKCVGLDNIDKNKSFVFVANHSSYLDIPAVFVAISNNLRIMYKKELEKIPIFGWFLKKSDFIAIEREEVASARSSLNKALKLIQQDVSVLIFPEGTRSIDGKVQDFKKGAMFLALRSGKPIVPVAIIGANQLLPRGKLFLRTGTIIVLIHKPIYIGKDLDKSQITHIISMLRNQIEESLTKYSN